MTLTRMRPRWAAPGSCGSLAGAGGVGRTIFPGSPSGAGVGAVVEGEDVLGLEVELALAGAFGFRAQGGRSDFSWRNAIPATRRAGTGKSKRDWGRRGVIDIGS